MSDKPFMELLEDVLDEMGLRTFDDPLKLHYRFGAFDPEMGLFRCFVHEDDCKITADFLEIIGMTVYWVALEYPDHDTVLQNLIEVSQKCMKVLGRMHNAYFILALEEGLSSEEESKLKKAFNKYMDSMLKGTYHEVLVWDRAILETKLQELTTSNSKER